jgi:hypothetical protein
MLALTPQTGPITDDGRPYCRSKCMAAGLEGCQDFMPVAPELFVDLLLGQCHNLPDIQCHNGTLSTYVESEPVCPYPLVLPDETSFESPAQVEMVTGTACAVPCPGLLFDESNWDRFSKIAISAYTISTVLVMASLWHYSKKANKNFNIVMVCIGCLNASFWMLIYHSINYSTNNGFICKGNSGYITDDKFCIFCGFMLLASGNWYSSWSFIIALHLWLSVRLNYTYSRLVKMRPYLVAFASFLFSLIFIPLGVGNLGYSWEGDTLNMCMNKNTYLGNEKIWHFLFTFTPLLLFGFLLPLVLMIDCIRLVADVRGRLRTVSR